MSRTKVFFCQATGEAIVSERYACAACGESTTREIGRFAEAARPPLEDRTIPCAKCGEPAEVRSQSWGEIFVRGDTGAEVGGAEKLPVGAVWEYGWRHGPDGRSLTVMTPAGSWFIDGRANNCTMPEENQHRCWVRHGRPEDGTLHVDKQGLTCGAGAGSILTGDFHGFLHNGELYPC